MYEALIQRLYAHCNTDQSDAITNEAAAAIAALQAENAEKDGRISRVEAERDKLLDRAHEAQVERDCARAERDAVVKARDEGLFFEFPCKVGGIVYYVLPDCGGYLGFFVSEPHRVTEIGTRGFWTSAIPDDEPDAMSDFTPWSDFGKTVFLTRAEAQAALGGGGDG